MDEIEVPIETVQEHMNEHVIEHGGSGWVAKAALTAAILAVFAALAALLAGYHVNEAMVSQIKASDKWSYYQAKGIKSYVLGAKLDLLTAMKQKTSEKDEEKLVENRKEQEEISKEAKEKEAESQHHFAIHEVLARAVTFFQIAIAISAVSVLTKRRKFLLLSVGFGLVGFCFLVFSFLK
ncbi:MAG: hypothetical protein JWQ35_1460 [Bacteriovoracaceae bacterium]|nr:hypothetical protein [Bacteriovoracaceae bacterium]